MVIWLYILTLINLFTKQIAYHNMFMINVIVKFHDLNKVEDKNYILTIRQERTPLHVTFQ